jgi:two-component system invasion response regulator UvrY
MIRVVIVDDHAVVREGLKRIIESAGDMTLVGEAASGEELLRELNGWPCDVVVVDLSMPGMPGLDVVREIRQRAPKLPVLVLSMYPEDQYAVRALTDGAVGYIHKGDPPAELVKAIRTAAQGRRYITEAVAECLASHVDTTAERLPHERLSNREFQVFKLIAAGKRVSEIARDLSLSIKTVSTFRHRILEKLGMSHNIDIVRYAIKHGLVE